MKGTRDKTVQQFLVVIVLFPFCFVTFRDVVEAILSAFSWDDSACQWVDEKFGLSSGGGSHIWLTDSLSLIPSLWCSWFLLGATGEVQYTHKATALTMLEVFGRWVAISTSTLVLPPAVGALLFYSLRLIIWEPLAILLSLALAGYLFQWAWKFPARRLRKVEAIHHFEKVKEV